MGNASVVEGVLALATAVNGLLAGLNVDTAVVKLPVRRRIGVRSYATFARGNDLGNGRVVYPLLGAPPYWHQRSRLTAAVVVTACLA